MLLMSRTARGPVLISQHRDVQRLPVGWQRRQRSDVVLQQIECFETYAGIRRRALGQCQHVIDQAARGVAGLDRARGVRAEIVNAGIVPVDRQWPAQSIRRLLGRARTGQVKTVTFERFSPRSRKVKQQRVNLIDKHQRPPAGGAFEAVGTTRFASRQPCILFRPRQAASSALVSNRYHIQVLSCRYQ
ncbi:hypothetical protein [Burkholderia lata]|uniref:hypothetical protein n=1 Tax=Burkholderia lata (strain ATCC 17760 / DSM 23089 / LMG 22485 / NCIMB 9086 / R18194 / 383) TaxID=482957 RepID=UPI001581FE06|nr:hypothetical protein [Burkholderia lata]